MTRPPMPLRTKDRGFSLVETMVAMALTLSLLATVLLVVIRTNDEARRIFTLIDTHHEGRDVVQLIERDVRMSGSGWGRIPVNVSNNGTATTLFAITPGPSTAALANDSIQIVGAWSTATVTSAAMPTAGSNLTVTSVAGFATNDLVVITNGSSAHLFRVTGVDVANRRLTHATTSPYNVVPAAWNWPVGGYGTGTPVYKIDILSYSVDSTSFQRPALVRRAFGGQPQVVAYDVKRFKVWYRTQDGALTRSPAVNGTGVALMDRVKPVVYTSLTDLTRPTFADSVWAEVKPRSF
jgi:hypothetical protein